MQTIPEGLLEEVSVLFHKYDIQNVADTLGQIAATFPNIYIQNTQKWLPAGMAFGYLQKHDIVNTLKTVAETFMERFLYNDDDCSLHGFRASIDKPCTTCGNHILNKILDQRMPTEECTRCNGTAVDPEFKEEIWLLHFQNHGSNIFYLIQENVLYLDLHIRKLPYNTPQTEVAATRESLIQSLRNKQKHDLIKYGDGRDKGFCLSLNINTMDVHDGETNTQGLYALVDVSEHFTTLIGSRT